MSKSRFIVGILSVSLLLINASLTVADHNEAYRLRHAGEILPLIKLIKIAKNLHPGELIEAELEHKYGRYIYEIEIAGNDGRFYDLYFDAATGELLQDKDKNNR